MSQWVIAVVNHSRNQMVLHKQNLKSKATRPKRNELKPKFVTPEIPSGQIQLTDEPTSDDKFQHEQDVEN